MSENIYPESAAIINPKFVATCLQITEVFIRHAKSSGNNLKINSDYDVNTLFEEFEKFSKKHDEVMKFFEKFL